jgi:hypothetical protein
MAVNKKSIIVNDNETITQGGKTYKNKEEYKNRDKGTIKVILKKVYSYLI